MALAQCNNRIGLHIGPLRICLETESSELGAIALEKYTRFISEISSESLNLSVAVTQGAGVEDARQVGVTCRKTRLEAYRSDFDGWVDSESGNACVRVFPTEFIDVTLDAFLRLAVSVWAIKHNCLLLHSAAVDMGGKGLLLLGKSGAGKSTITRLALTRQYNILTDEIAMAYKDDGSWKVAGTPFHGELEAAQDKRDALLIGAYLLRKSASNRFGFLRKGSELRQFMSNILCFGLPGVLGTKLLGLSLDFVNCVGLRALHFQPDGRIWDFINESLQGNN